MNDLPELPFEKVLSYLSLEDRLKSRAVSRRWYHKTNSLRVKSLCYSGRANDIGHGRCRPVGGAFRQNFISCTRFASFFNVLRPTILSNLQHLCLCDLLLTKENVAAFGITLQRFGQLKELDLIRVGNPNVGLKLKLELNLPMLHIIRLEEVNGIQRLTLDAPNLKTVKLWKCHFTLKLNFVRVELLERLAIDKLRHITVKSMKSISNSLECLICHDYPKIDATLLSSLKQLKEIHLSYVNRQDISEFFELKQRSGRTELKVYLYGLLLSGPDPAIDCLRFGFIDKGWRCLPENPSRLADEIPFHDELSYEHIEDLAPGSQMNLLKRFSDLCSIDVGLIKDIERFLQLLKDFSNITKLCFSGEHPPPQELLDRLPELCTVQILSLSKPIADFRFLFRLRILVNLSLYFSIERKETVRELFEELPLLRRVYFKCKNKYFMIETDHSKRFEVRMGDAKNTEVADLNAAIQFVAEKVQRKRKAKVLSE